MRSHFARIEYSSSGRLGYSCFTMPTWNRGALPQESPGQINVLELKNPRTSLSHFVSTISSEGANFGNAQSSLRINGRFAKCLGLNDRDEIMVVREIAETPVTVTRAWVSCVSPDDWEILEPNSEILSNNLLNQLRVVHAGLKFPFWITKSMTVNLIIDKIEPSSEFGLLDNASEIIIPSLAEPPRPQISLRSSQFYVRLHPVQVNEGFQSALLQLPSLKLLLTNTYNAFIRRACLPLHHDSRSLEQSSTSTLANCFHVKLSAGPNSEVILKVFILDFLDIDHEMLENNFPITNPPCLLIHANLLQGQLNEGLPRAKSTVLLEQVDEKEREQKIEFCPLQTIAPSKSIFSFGGYHALINEGVEFLAASLSLGSVQHKFLGPGHGSLLIAGREGSGKTSLAIRLTEELAQFPYFVHSELISCTKLRGKKPEHLEKEFHASFDAANKLQPAIVILDDFDILIPNPMSEQENVAEEFQHFRTAETILACIMKCKSQQISFIIASSGTDTINSYWRTRPGFQFFQKQLCIPPPDSRDRLDIFKKCLHRYQMAPERTSASSSENTTCATHEAQHVHVNEKEGERWSRPPQSSDPAICMGLIKPTTERNTYLNTGKIIDSNDTALARECHCCPLSGSMKRSLDSVHDEFATAQYLSNLAQKWALHLFEKKTAADQKDDDSAFSKIIQDEIGRVGRISEAAKSLPKITWGPVGGLTDVKNELIKILQWPIKYAHLFEKAPVKLPCGILFYGYPGTGKTLLGLSLPSIINAKFIHVKGPELLSKYIGASEQAVKDTFKRAKDSKPCILFFDEFDSLVPRRGHDSTGVTDRVVNQFLAEMDGVDGGLGSGVYLIASTSRPDLIDPAILRPGRLDKCLFFPLPSQDERVEILKRQSENMNFSQWNTSDWDEIGHETEGFSGADLHSLLFSTQMTAIHEYLDKLNIDPELSTSSWKTEDNTQDKHCGLEGIIHHLRFYKNFECTSTEKNASTTSATGTAPVVSKVDVLITVKHMKESLKTFQPSLYGKEFERFQNIFQAFSMARNGQRPLTSSTGPAIEQRATLA